MAHGRPKAIVRSFYAGEVGKQILTAALFALPFVVVKPLEPLAVFAGFLLVLAVVSWFAPLLMRKDFRDLRAFEANMAEQTASGYIQHHLQNLTFGQLPGGDWGFAHTPDDVKQMGFMALHIDTLGWSVFMGLIFILLFRMAAKRATSRCARSPCRTLWKCWSSSLKAASRTPSTVATRSLPR